MSQEQETAMKVITADMQRGLKPATMTPLSEELKPIGMTPVSAPVQSTPPSPGNTAPAQTRKTTGKE